MMLDRLREAAEFVNLNQEVDGAYLEEVVADSPKYLLDIIAQIVEAMLLKLNVQEEDIERFTDQIKERDMGELFANFVGYDVQATRQEAREEGIKEGLQKGIKELICALKELYVADETIKLQLIKRYELSKKEADKTVEEYMQL